MIDTSLTLLSVQLYSILIEFERLETFLFFYFLLFLFFSSSVEKKQTYFLPVKNYGRKRPVSMLAYRYALSSEPEECCLT